jgi:hypothetical protein
MPKRIRLCAVYENEYEYYVNDVRIVRALSDGTKKHLVGVLLHSDRKARQVYRYLVTLHTSRRDVS